MYGIRRVPPTPTATEPTITFERLVIELGELFAGHVRQTDAEMTELRNRIVDLEGHAEHGPSGRCGVCEPDDADEIAYRPETVGAPLYAIHRIMNDTEKSDDDD
jgi:hypothetical protein